MRARDLNKEGMWNHVIEAHKEPDDRARFKREGLSVHAFHLANHMNPGQFGNAPDHTHEDVEELLKR